MRMGELVRIGGKKEGGREGMDTKMRERENKRM
jgi:hypothetical protein